MAVKHLASANTNLFIDFALQIKNNVSTKELRIGLIGKTTIKMLYKYYNFELFTNIFV